MNKIKIPTQFEIGGRTVKIKYKKNMVDESDSVGYARYRKNEIWLQEKCDGVYRHPDQIQESYCHEIVHWILNMMGENKLNDDEKMVSQFAQYLHQILKTSEY